MLQRYTEEHPDVTIEPRLINFSDFNRTLLQGAAAGDLPDIALVNAFDTTLFAESGIIQDLTERVDSLGRRRRVLPRRLRDESLGRAELRSAPSRRLLRPLVQRRPVFAEAGATPPATWDELVHDRRRR